MFVLSNAIYLMRATVSSELQLLLDPQDYDYLMPNDGYVGFHVTIKTSGSLGNKLVSSSTGVEEDSHLSQNTNSLMIGSKFQTHIRLRHTANSLKVL
ncbi:unnamed protein product [Protopolystoma xenopodis]|uniref:Uncharacterized protein n=1 Tax=Protopolystoma xenopodis TaxID=117903 RepID=A0A3S4ZEK2_9PLAT|nr:unnamed protein product [Protopolystoma xenopodis]